MTTHLLAEFAILLASVVLTEYLNLFHGRATFLPAVLAGFAAFLVASVLHHNLIPAGHSIGHVVLFYAGLLVVIPPMGAIVFELMLPRESVANLSLSLIALSAISVVVLWLDPVNGGLGIDARPFRLRLPGSDWAGAVVAVGSVVFLVCFLRDRSSPYYVAGRLESSQPWGELIIPIRRGDLRKSAVLRLSAGMILIAASSVQMGVLEPESFGFRFVFDVLSCLLMLEGLRPVLHGGTSVSAALVYLIGPVVFVSLSEVLRSIHLGEPTVGELRSLMMWVGALATYAVSTSLGRLTSLAWLRRT